MIHVDVDAFNAAERFIQTALPHGHPVDLRQVKPANIVRADALVALLTGEPGTPLPRPALRLIGARVTGPLKLAFAELGFPVMFHDCVFEEPLDLFSARTRFLSFSRSTLPGLIATNLQVDGNLRFADTRIDGELRVAGSKITGSLILDGARLINPRGTALQARYLDVGAALSAVNGFTTQGETLLISARVGGPLILDDAHLDAPDGLALGASNLTSQIAVFARRMRVHGEASFRFARVTGPLTLGGSHLTNPGGYAFRGEGLTAGGGLFLSQIQTQGKIRLSTATVSQMLNLDGSTLRNPGGIALHADGLTVDGALQALDGFTAEGELTLHNATITGPAHFEGATLSNPGGSAFSANGLIVGKVLNLCTGFTADGRIRLTNVRVGSRLCFDDAAIRVPPDEIAVKCWRLETPELALRTRTPLDGIVDLRHARVGILRDDPATLPRAIHMDGLTYDTLAPRLPAHQRLRWLDKDPSGYLPNTYEQLATMYRRLGDDADARETLLFSQRKRRTTLPWYATFWGHIQDLTVGYGYRPLRAASWLALILIAGTIYFTLNHPPPLKPGESPPFSAFAYALDLLLPIIDFGQAGAFAPQGPGQWIALTLIASGWILATTIAAGVTRSLRRI